MTKEPRHYGIMEGNAVVFEGTECWWHIHDKWFPLPYAEYLMKGQGLAQNEYEKRFGKLPHLPSTAFQDGSILPKAAP